MCLAPNSLSKLTRVLQYPKFQQALFRSHISVHEIIAYILEHAILFQDIFFVAPITEDPSDNMFINCALASRSDWIVSGDQHLLKLKQFETIRIVKPIEFLKMIS